MQEYIFYICVNVGNGIAIIYNFLAMNTVLFSQLFTLDKILNVCESKSILQSCCVYIRIKLYRYIIKLYYYDDAARVAQNE